MKIAAPFKFKLLQYFTATVPGCLTLSILAAGLSACATTPRNTMKYYEDNTVAFKFSDSSMGAAWGYTNNPKYALAVSVRGSDYNMKDIARIYMQNMKGNTGWWGRVIVKLNSGEIIAEKYVNVSWRVCEQASGCTSLPFSGKPQASEKLNTRAISEEYLNNSRPTSNGVIYEALPSFANRHELQISPVSKSELQDVISKFSTLSAKWHAGAPEREEAEQNRIKQRTAWVHNSKVGARVICRTTFSKINHTDNEKITCNGYEGVMEQKEMKASGWQEADVVPLMDRGSGSAYHWLKITYHKIN